MSRTAPELDHADACASPAVLGAHLEPDAYKPVRHLVRVGHEVRGAIRAGGGNILVTMPPGHGKSVTCSKVAPVWYLELFPEHQVILAAHTATYAESWGRKAREYAERHAARLVMQVRQDSRAVGDWTTTAGGGMVSVGVGGPITGRRGNLLIADDPIKDAVQANSDVWRERCWEWWQETFWTRREPGAVVLLVMTRWHEDDIAGRILAREPSKWRTICFPAVADGADELGRKAGDALWPARFPRPELDSIRSSVGSYAWEALYQQRPAPPEGSMFRKDRLVAFRDRGDSWLCGNGKVIPKKAAWVAQVADTALTEKDDADYTAVVTFACGPRGEILVLEVARARLAVPEQWAFLRAARNRWRSHVNYRWLGVEDSAAGKAVIQIAQRAGEPVRALKLGRGEWRTPDKVTRATQAAVLNENGLLMVPESDPEWLGPFLHELLYFPRGTHDDQVDALALAVMEAREQPMMAPQNTRVRTPEDEEAERSRSRFDGYVAGVGIEVPGGRGV